MDKNNRAQETPGSSLPVHVEHSQNLQETNPPGKSQVLKCLGCARTKCTQAHTDTHIARPRGRGQPISISTPWALISC